MLRPMGVATAVGATGVTGAAGSGAATASALVDAATVVLDAGSGLKVFTLTTTGGVGATRKIGNISSPAIGHYYLRVTADAASRAITWDTGYIFGGNARPNLSGTSGAKDLFAIFYDGTNFWVGLAVADGRNA